MFTLRTFATIGLVGLTLSGTAMATASQAEAHNNFGAGLATGLIGGALVGGAIASAPARTAYYGAPVYAAPAYATPVYGPYVHCHTAWHENHYGQVYPVRACAD